jgi:hypothetical protein
MNIDEHQRAINKHVIEFLERMPINENYVGILVKDLNAAIYRRVQYFYMGSWIGRFIYGDEEGYRLPFFEEQYLLYIYMSINTSDYSELQECIETPSRCDICGTTTRHSPKKTFTNNEHQHLRTAIHKKNISKRNKAIKAELSKRIDRDSLSIVMAYL